MDIKTEFIESASPISRLLGHSLTAALGFSGFALISLIPIGALWLLAQCGMTELANHLQLLETLLLLADAGLFGLVFLSGVAVFATELLSTSWARMKKAWKDGANG